MMTNALAILMVVTSTGVMPDGKPTGLWMDEFSTPYEIFLEEGYTVTVASPHGGQVPVDPRSMTDQSRPENAGKALLALSDSVVLESLDLSAFDAVFFPGGHGTMFDFPQTESVRETVEAFVNSERPSAFVCHGPAALVGAKNEQGHPLVSGRRVTGFTNQEEEAVELTEAVPFLLETRLKELGADFAPAENFEAHVVVDGMLVTGQNPASSEQAARALVKLLR